MGANGVGVRLHARRRHVGALARAGDLSRKLVGTRQGADAPLDSDRGLASLNELDRASWTDAVGAYARGLSRQDPTRDRTLALLEGRLGASGDSPNLAHDTVDDSLRTVLERAAPVYRKMWWASHRAGNRTWVEGTQKLVAMAGGPALQCITD